MPGEAESAASNDSSPGVVIEGDSSASIVLAAPGEPRPELELTLHEGGDPVAVDLYRRFGLGEPLTVRVDEVGFSGNQSPRKAGQYQLSGDGIVSFDAGQSQATLTLGMADDAEREPDRQVALLLRDYYNADSALGTLNLRLLDDDQRAFEAGHATNTVSFATNQLVVPERDPAVQIDVLRLNPDQSTITVTYKVQDITAKDGEDYFSPGRQFVTFGPGQRTARLLIPLVQDSLPESDEAFSIELDVAELESNTFRRIAVIIRDDDSGLD
jgi:hypothetical protein